MQQEQIILITGATGRQGGAAVEHLLADNWRLRALTRDPLKAAARDLARRGVEVIKGNLDDRDSVKRAIDGCYGLFSVQQFWETGFAGEIRQGKLLAELARDAGVQHVVYSSVGGAERDTGIPHFDSKWQIERHIRELDLPATVLRPVFFFDNFSSSEYRDSIRNGTLALPMPPDHPLQMVAVNDIGAFVAMAFRRPQQFIGQSIELAGDELTMTQVAQILSQSAGRKVKFQSVPLEEIEPRSRETAVMFRWFVEHGYQANIPALREMYPQLMTFNEWVVNVWRPAVVRAA